MRGGSGQTAFEAPVNTTAMNAAQPQASAPAATEAPKPKKGQPRLIMLEEPIGWMQGGVLRQFKADQLVSDRNDIAALIHAGAIYLVITP